MAFFLNRIILNFQNKRFDVAKASANFKLNRTYEMSCKQQTNLHSIRPRFRIRGRGNFRNLRFSPQIVLYIRNVEEKSIQIF